MKRLVLLSLLSSYAGASAQTEEVRYPSAFRVALGQLREGNLASLQADDGDVLRVRTFFISNHVHQINVEVDFQTGITNPSSLRVETKTRMQTPGYFHQSLQLRDQVANSWVNHTENMVDTSFSVKTVNGTAPFNRYVRDNNVVTARYMVRKMGPSGITHWVIECDFARATIRG